MDGGLLIERYVGTTSTASGVVDQSLLEEGLPVMFSLLHPLDDISPIVCRYPSTGEMYPCILYVCYNNTSNLIQSNKQTSVLSNSAVTETGDCFIIVFN